MGLLDSMDDPTMALAMGLLGSGGYSRMPISTGQGLAAGYGAWQEAKRAQQQKALQDLQAQHMSQQIAQSKMQMDATARALKTKELLGQALRDGAVQHEPAQGASPYGGGYSPAVAGAFGVPEGVPRIDTPKPSASPSYSDRMMAAAMKAGDVDAYNEAIKMKLEEKKSAPKFATDVRVVSINGKPTPVQMADDGSWRPMGADVSPAEKLHFADNGQLTGIGIDPYSGKVMTPGVKKLQSPDSIASNAVTMRGQNMTNERAKDSLNFQREQASKPSLQNIEGVGLLQVSPNGTASPVTLGGKPITSQKPLTESQGISALYGNRASEANQILGDMEKKGTTQPGYIKRIVESTPLIGNGLGAATNWTQSNQQQMVEQAQRNFINAILRRESGAVISPSEFDNARKQYFPQPGDSEEVIAQKNANRETAIKGLSVMAGPAGDFGSKTETVRKYNPATGRIE